MPQWLQQMVAPTLMLWLYAAAYGVVTAKAFRGSAAPQAESMSGVALSLVISFWVMTDARKRGRRLCYDFDSFLYFAWPVMVPVYLFQTRGLRAFLTLLCFAGIWLLAWLPGLAIFFAREVLGR